MTYTNNITRVDYNSSVWWNDTLVHVMFFIGKQRINKTDYCLQSSFLPYYYQFTF